MGYRGGRAKMYYESTTQWAEGDSKDVPGSPTWVEIGKAIDVTLNLEEGESNLDSRETDWHADGGGIKDGALEFNYRIRKGADTVYDALRGAYLGGYGLLIAIMDGDITADGTKGWQAIYGVRGMAESQPLEDGSEAAMTLRLFPAYDASGARIIPTYTTISTGP